LTVPILRQHQNPTRSQRFGQRPPAPREFSGLVTGDRRHLLSLGEYEGIRIVTPRQLLEILERD
jgi:hypothetical protein